MRPASSIMDHNSLRKFQRPAANTRGAVILAGGDGSRLRPLSRLIAGDDRPKQFCPILGDETLLDRTRRRAALSVAAENTFFSLTAKHEQYYDRALWNVAPAHKLVQPANKGTAPALLYSLLRIAESDPDATVAFFPSDHFFTDDAAFMANVDAAFAAVEMLEGSVVLLGIEPEKAETSYCWIEPVDSLFGGLPGSVSGVKRFWEKPQARDARRLLTSGGLWNSFVMIGKIESFFELFREHLPVMFRMFTAALSTSGTRGGAVRSLYEWIEETNFSSRVLERAADRLFVKRVAGVGWSDLGEPQRVIGTLAALGVEPAWMRTAAAA